MTHVEPVKTIETLKANAVESAERDARYRMQWFIEAVEMQPRQAALHPIVMEWLDTCLLEGRHVSHVDFSAKHDAPMIVVSLGPDGRFDHTSWLITKLEEQYGQVTKTVDFHDARSREYFFGAVIEHEGTWRQTVKCNLVLDVQFGNSKFCRVVQEEVGQETVTKYERRIECDPAPGTVIEGA